MTILYVDNFIILANVEYVQEGPTSIVCDNYRCITFAKNPTHHSRPNISMYNITSLERNRENQEIFFQVLSNRGNDSGRANQITCKGYASNINKGNGFRSL